MVTIVVKTLREGFFPLFFIFLVAGLTSCDIKKRKDDRAVIMDFFTHLNRGEYRKAVDLTDSEAKELMEYILSNFSSEVRDMVFPNLSLLSVEYDELLTKHKKGFRAYRVRYILRVDENIKNEELKKVLKDSERGEAVFYLKGGSIHRIVDIQGNVFVK